MKKAKYIFLFLILLLLSAKNANNSGPVRKRIYLQRFINRYPSVGNDIKLKIKNKNREVYALLSQKSTKLLVMLHGNGALINDMESTAKIFYNNGYSTLLIEYPGFGLSYRHKTTEANIYSDCTEMIRHVQEKYNYDIDHTCFFGWSLGTGVAVEMAKRKLGSKVLLVAPFTSIPDVAHKKFVRVLPYIVIADRFSNKLKAPGIKIPVVLIHGTKDRLIPYAMSEKLHKLFKNSELITLQGADHVNIFRFMNNKTWEKVFKFLN